MLFPKINKKIISSNAKTKHVNFQRKKINPFKRKIEPQNTLEIIFIFIVKKKEIKIFIFNLDGSSKLTVTRAREH